MTNVINFAAAAMVRRAEEVVDLLNAGHGFDHDRAARFLQAVRQGDDGEILEWLFDHGVSSDWLLFGDPGPMICSLAARLTAERAERLTPAERSA